MRHVATHPLLSPNMPRMIKNAMSPKMGFQGPRFDTLHAQNNGQKRMRSEVKVTRIRGLWIVKYRGDIPGAARPIKSAVFIRRKCKGMNNVG